MLKGRNADSIFGNSSALFGKNSIILEKILAFQIFICYALAYGFGSQISRQNCDY
jgi:hypothetical protein